MQKEEITVEYVDPKNLTAFDYSRSLFPKLQGDAYEMLKQDIKEHGIRTPLDITKENLILCGNERHRIALELGFEKVPIIYYGVQDEIDQKIRCIKDNLARKNVDFRTKLKCYKELRTLRGLKHGETRLERDEQGRMTPLRSEERSGKMSEDDIAKEVGFSRPTMERAEEIEDSSLPTEMKAAAFDGRLSIRPIAQLTHEPENIQKAVIKQTMEKLKEGEDSFSVETLIRDTKERITVQQALKDAGVPTVDQQIQGFYKNLAPPKPKNSKPKRQDLIQSVNALVEGNHLKCKVCGEASLRWKCGHEFS